MATTTAAAANSEQGVDPKYAPEKIAGNATATDISEVEEALNGYVLDPKGYPNNAEGLKKTSDGRYVLIPQPSESERDPLSWSSAKKARMLAIIAYIAALADYTGGTGIIAVIPQAV